MTDQNTAQSTKRSIIVGAVAGSLFAIATGAIAAAIVTLTAEQIGEGFTTVSPCDSAFTVGADTPVWDDTASAFLVSSVTVSDVDLSCVGENVAVEVLNSTPVSIASADGAVTGAATSLPLSAPVAVDDIDAYAAVIYTP